MERTIETVQFYYTRGPGESGPTQHRRCVTIELPDDIVGTAGIVRYHPGAHADVGCWELVLDTGEVLPITYYSGYFQSWPHEFEAYQKIANGEYKRVDVPPYRRMFQVGMYGPWQWKDCQGYSYVVLED